MPEAPRAPDDFETFSWHDNPIYGFEFVVGDPEQNDWRGDLVLDIDHITEWLCEPDGRCRFRIAPASLAFHQVTDLKLALDYGDSGLSTTINEATIHAITREPVQPSSAVAEITYYRWRIALNVPPGGEIIFGASGFTQTLRATPRLCDEQRLPVGTRRLAP